MCPDMVEVHVPPVDIDQLAITTLSIAPAKAESFHPGGSNLRPTFGDHPGDHLLLLVNDYLDTTLAEIRFKDTCKTSGLVRMRALSVRGLQRAGLVSTVRIECQNIPSHIGV